MEEDLINGDGSSADFLNAYGDQYAANQSGYDVADNGRLTKTDTSASTSSPSWYNSLTGLLNQGVSLAGTVGSAVAPFTNKTGSTSAANNTTANTTGGATGSSSTLLWVIGGAIALVAVWLLTRKS